MVLCGRSCWLWESIVSSLFNVSQPVNTFPGSLPYPITFSCRQVRGMRMRFDAPEELQVLSVWWGGVRVKCGRNGPISCKLGSQHHRTHAPSRIRGGRG